MATKVLMQTVEFGPMNYEQTIIMRERPLSFLCANGKNHFLFYETVREEGGTEWLVAPVTTVIAKSILRGVTAVQEPFRNRIYRHSDDVFRIYKDAKESFGKVRIAKEADIAELPRRDVYRSIA